MKKTLFITMLAAALLGGQAFAADAILTKLEGTTDITSNITYSGKKVTGSGEVAKDAKVTISADQGGSDYSRITVNGGWSNEGSASDNTVTMTGGQVKSVCAGKGATTVTKNTFNMEGGTVTGAVYGGSGSDNCEVSENYFIMTDGTVSGQAFGGRTSNGTAQNNVAIVAGSSTITGNLCGGYSSEGDAKNNKVYLVGTGAIATINEQQYTGGALTLKTVSAGEATGTDATSSDNSIDIYGTGIKVSGDIQKAQILNFNISQSQLTGDYKGASMLTLTSKGLDLTKVVTIGINAVDVDVQDWTPGTSVTLVQLTGASNRKITGLENGTEVGIKQGEQVVATGKLVLSDDLRTLSLTIAQSTPEPTTGTLGLLALAGLAARRRKK